jgi:hypothetical protein
MAAATGWNVATSHRSAHSSGSHPGGRGPRDQGEAGLGIQNEMAINPTSFLFRTKPSISFNVSWRW